MLMMVDIRRPGGPRRQSDKAGKKVRCLRFVDPGLISNGGSLISIPRCVVYRYIYDNDSSPLPPPFFPPPFFSHKPQCSPDSSAPQLQLLTSSRDVLSLRLLSSHRYVIHSHCSFHFTTTTTTAHPEARPPTIAAQENTLV